MWSARYLLFLRQTGHIFPRKNANFGRFEVAFDRPEFDRTQQCLFLRFFVNWAPEQLYDFRGLVDVGRISISEARQQFGFMATR